MKLRYFQTYDNAGVDSEVELQYWDADAYMWMPVNLIRVQEDQQFMYDAESDC